MPKDECKHYWVLDAESHGVCKYCGDEKQFTTPSDLAAAPTWHHRDKNVLQDLDAIEEMVTDPIVANEAANMREKPDPEEEHSAPSLSTIKCPVPGCGKEIGAKGLGSHLYFKHQIVKGDRLDAAKSSEEPATEEKPFKCPYCPNSYAKGKALGPHIRFKHPEKLFERRYGAKVVPIADKEAALMATAEHIGRLIDALDVQKTKLIELLALTMQAVISAPTKTIK